MNINKAIKLAFDLHTAGNLEQSEILCRKILKKQPKCFDALQLLGFIHYQKKDYGSSIKYLKKALDINNTNANVYNNLGNSYQMNGNYDDAIQSYQKVLQINPQHIEAYNNLGCSFYEQGSFDDAIGYFKKALQLNPNYAEAYSNLGNLYVKKEQFDEAINCYQKAVKINPNYVEAHSSLGGLYAKKEQFDEALIYCQKALQINPNYADAYSNLGVIYEGKGLLDKALSCYKKALDLKPDDANQYWNLGNVFEDKGLLDEAISYYQKAIHSNTEDARSHYNLSLALLRSGNFSQGWDIYEWRWELKKHIPHISHSFPQPLWDGTSLKGKTLFVYDEQGVGDEIMFASCLPEIISQATLCIVETENRLVPLFTRSFPEVKVIERITKDSINIPDLSMVDLKIPIASLPKYLRRHLSDFPKTRSYLIPDVKMVEKWQSRYTEIGDGLKVGISWRGGKDPKVQRKRSIQIEQWVKLLSIPGCEFINLQYGDCTEEKKTLREKFGIILHDWEDADPLKDLDDFAAQIAALDLIVSVDNATVHMAGALGKPVWTLLPFNCDWRWMQEFEDTPWYATIRLFRQKSLGDWGEVFERVSSNLRQYIATGVMPDIDHKYSYKHLLKEAQEEVCKSLSHAEFLSSDRTYQCAVITPIGPGHERLYIECNQSIQSAIHHSKGPFEEITTIVIDDTAGKMGRSAARNEAVKRAKSANIDWLFFLDADDLIFANAFELILQYVNEYDAIWGNIVEITPGSNQVTLRIPQLITIQSIKELLLYDPYITLQMGHFVRTDVAFNNPFNESMNTGEDFEYYLRIWSHYRCIKIREPLFINRRGLHSIGSRSADGRQWRIAVEQIIKEYKKKYGMDYMNVDNIQIMNNKTLEFAEFAKQKKIANRDTYSQLSRILPYYGYFTVSCYECPPFLMLSNNDDLVVNSILWTGSYEPMSLSVWARLADSANYILSVGANTGIYGYVAARKNKQSRVICFEPLDLNYSRIRENTMLNSLNNLSVLPFAVTNKDGEIDLDIYSDENFLTPESSTIHDITKHPILRKKVKSICIDTLVQLNSIQKIDLVKIAAEDSVKEVLEGMIKTIETSRPDLIISVSNDKISKHLTELFKKFGYNFFEIKEDSRNIRETDIVTSSTSPLDLNRLISMKNKDELQ